MFKQWVNLLCLAAQEEERGRLPKPADIAYHLGISTPAVFKLINLLADAGLLDMDEDSDALWVHNWEQRQLNTQALAESGSYGNHVRWHAERSITDPSCGYCQAIATRPEGESPSPRDKTRGEEIRRDQTRRDVFLSRYRKMNDVNG